MSSRVWESAVIEAPIEKVWELVRRLDFSYLPTVASVEIDGKAAPDDVGVTKVIRYKDGTNQRIKLVGLSDATNSVSWDLIESEPPVAYSSCSHTVRLRRVTDLSYTFVTWSTDYSKDASLEVTEDQRHKQKENFGALRRAAAAKDAKQEAKEVKAEAKAPEGRGPGGPGAKKEQRELSAEELALVNSCRPQIESKSQRWDVFSPVSIRIQVVSGLNHFVKIHVGGDRYIHVTIWKKATGQVEVTDVSTGKAKVDNL